MTTCKDLVQITLKYKECFKASGLDIMVMPLNSGNKNPKFRHKGGVYKDTEHVFKESEWIDKDRKLCNYGWLLNDQIFCVDLDGFGETDELKKESADNYFAMISEKFPDDVSRALIEKTRKGYHLIWKRTPALAELTDHTDAFRHNNMRGIDIKTVCKAKTDEVPTQSILAVYPSNGKQWMDGHNPLEGSLIKECSDEFAEWILKNISKPEPKKETKTETKCIKKETKKDRDERKTIEELKRLLPLLTEEYYEKISDGGDWNLWMKVCRGIINICGPTSEGYELFVQHCSRSSSFVEQDNIRYWEKFTTDEPVEKPIGIGSFYSWTGTEPPDGDFLDICKEFEEHHAKIINKSAFIKLIPDDIKSTGYKYFNQTELKTSYQHLKYTNRQGERVSFIDKWLSYQDMRRYDDIVNAPPAVKWTGNVLNVWDPFPPEKITSWDSNSKKAQDGLKMILDHIKVLSGNDEKVYDYLVDWIGTMLKYPHIKLKCITLISKQGAGKGTLMDLFKLLLGASRVLVTSTPSRECWGMFNGLMERAFLVNLDELSKKETADAEGQIKNLVTDPTLTINNKGRSQYVIDSYHHFIITTNNEDPIKTSADDRRNLIIRASDEKCPSVMGAEESGKYFNELRMYMQDPEVIKTVYEYFKNRPDLEHFNLRPIPVTEHQQNLKELSKTPVESWLEDFVSRCEDDEVELKSGEVYSDFCTWNSQYNKEYKVPNNVAFGVRLANLKIAEITKKHKKDGEYKIFDIVSLRKKFGLIDELMI